MGPGAPAAAVGHAAPLTVPSICTIREGAEGDAHARPRMRAPPVHGVSS